MSVHQDILRLRDSLNQRIIGQEALTLRLIIALLSDGHLLVEGAPGLAKTKAIKELAAGVAADFHRIQFTPDLLPGDVTGTEIYRAQTGAFEFQPGPVFHNLLLADEINRAPAKVQSALLEAMGERQVTIGKVTHRLPDLFLVMATQNPIEQEGTYPLPEAQLDRFLMYVKIDYPDVKAERKILQLAREEHLKGAPQNHHKISQEQILAARKEMASLHLSDALEEYIVRLVMATRTPKGYGEDLADCLQYGASPRGSISLELCARAHAWLQGRDYVSPEDIHAIAHDVLRHRLILSYHAEVSGVDADSVIDRLLERVVVP
jgi:MoxR-like ATPase